MKAHLTWDQQIQLLRANGLQINDENSAFTLLSTYGYFRLRGYFHVFLESQEDDHSKKSSKFLGGSDINQIADLMEFDQKLRVLLFDALSQFEIALRTKFSYFGGEIDPQLHVTGIGLHLPASKSKSNADHLRWLEKYNDKLPRHRAEPFVLWHIQNYEGNMPIWVAVEIFDFGDISKLLRLSSQKLASNIANEFGTQPSMFKSWVTSLNELRNAVVHQNRLWNRTFTYSTGKKLSNLPSSLKHLSSAELDARLIYTRLAILVSIDEASSLKINFKARMMELFQSFPENEFVTIEQMGFPEGWKEFPLWQG